MVINSLAVSFLPLAILSLQSQVQRVQKGIVPNLTNIFVRTGLVGIGTLALNMILKAIFKGEYTLKDWQIPI